MPRDADAFVANQARIKSALAEHSVRESDLQNELIEKQIGFKALKDEHDDIEAEIASLKTRRSNIPSRNAGHPQAAGRRPWIRRG